MQAEKETNRRLGEAIAQMRKTAGLTQDQASEHLGIGKEAYSRIERGVNGVSVAKLTSLAELFKCDFTAFFPREVTGTLKKRDLEKMLVGLSSDDKRFAIEFFEKLTDRLRKADS